MATMTDDEKYVMQKLTDAYSDPGERLVVLAQMLSNGKLEDWRYWLFDANQLIAQFGMED